MPLNFVNLSQDHVDVIQEILYLGEQDFSKLIGLQNNFSRAGGGGVGFILMTKWRQLRKVFV